MTRKTKGRNRWHGATQKTFCADNHSIRTRIDSAVVWLAVWGRAAVKLADWLIHRGGRAMHDSEQILFLTPAAPGFYVLTPCQDEAGAVCEASREPVIAWALGGMGCVYPVGMYDGLQDRGDPAILCPDGEVRAFNESWANLAAWLDDQKSRGVRYDDLC